MSSKLKIQLINTFILIALLSQLSAQPKDSVVTKLPSDCEKAKSLIVEAAKIPSPEDRIALLEDAVVLCPQADVPHFRLALALEEEQDINHNKNPDYSPAEVEYRETLKINPSHAGAYYQMAGIEYITCRFDSAKVHFQKFLVFDKGDKGHQEMHQAAERLSIKCGWLSVLPENSIKPQSLRKDPDRYSGIYSLIGDIALELGINATRVTGKIGYSTMGQGIWAVTKLFENSGPENFGWVATGILDKKYSKLNKKSLEKLPKMVNKKGINSQEVKLLIMAVFISGWHLNINASELSPFAYALIHNYDIESHMRSAHYIPPDGFPPSNEIINLSNSIRKHALKLHALDFVSEAVLYNYAELMQIPKTPEMINILYRYFGIPDHYKLKGPKNQLQWATNRIYYIHAYETIGDALVKKEPALSSIYYSHAIQLTELLLENLNDEIICGGFIHETEICQLWGYSKLLDKYKLVIASSKDPSSEIEALESLIDIYSETLGEKLNPNIRNKIAGGFVEWANNTRLNRNRNLQVLKIYKNFVENVEISEKSGQETFNILLGWTLLLDSWAEFHQAVNMLEKLKSVSPNFQGKTEEYKIFIGHYNKKDNYYNPDLQNVTETGNRIAALTYANAGLVDSAYAHILRCNWSTQSSNDLLYLTETFRKFLVFDRYNEAKQVWKIYNNLVQTDSVLESHTSKLSEIVMWALERDSMLQDFDTLMSRIDNWAANSVQKNWSAFEDNVFLLTQLLALPSFTRQTAEIVFKRIIHICRSNSNCSEHFQSKLLSIFYWETAQYDRCINYLQSPPEPLKPEPVDSLSIDYLFDIRKEKLALIHHELGNYDKAIKIRRELLERVLPFTDVLPERVAVIKARLAESLAAAGKKREAETLLIEALKFFENLPISIMSANHKRTKEGLEKLRRGETDIAPHGIGVNKFGQ